MPTSTTYDNSSGGSSTFAEPAPPKFIAGGGFSARGAGMQTQQVNPAYVAWQRRKEQHEAQQAQRSQEQMRTDLVNTPENQRQRENLMVRESQTERRRAPVVRDSAAAAQQAQLAQLLLAQANGTAPSLAAMQIQQQQNQAIAQQMAMANSARPDLGGFAARNAARNSGVINAQGAQQSAMAQLAERNAAQQALGGLLAQQRSQDLQLGTTNAGLQQQQTGMNDARLLELLRQQQSLAAQAQAGTISYWQLQQGQQALELQRQQLQAQIANQPGWFERFLGTTIGPGLAIAGGAIGGPAGAALGGAIGGQVAGGFAGGGAYGGAPKMAPQAYVPPTPATAQYTQPETGGTYRPPQGGGY